MTDNRGPEYAGILGLFFGLTWIFVLLRVYVRAFLTRSWGSDDNFIVISLVFFTAYVACSLAGVKYGTGRHIVDINPQDIPKALYYWWLCELFYTITMVFVRLSIAVFLLRICVKSIYKIIIYATLGMVIAYSIFYCFLVIFQCSPVSFFWGQYEGMAGSCIGPAIIPNASIVHSVVNFIADWVFCLLPIALIWNLQMNMRTKVSVATLLSLGLLAGIATMIRVPYIKTQAITQDFLWRTTDIAIWSTIEPGLGIIAASGATFRPLFRSFYSLTTGASRAGYLQQNSHNVVPYRASRPVAMEMKAHTVTASVGESIEWARDKEVIRVERTVVITREENGDGCSEFSEEEPQTRARGERDMV